MKTSLAEGFPEVQHWSGRKARDRRKAVPKGTEAIVVVLDRINHGLAQRVRKESRRLGVPVLFHRRTVSSRASEYGGNALRKRLRQIGSRQRGRQGSPWP